MPLAVLEMNDQALLIQAEGGSLYAEPGFARLTAEGIESGEAARASAWREPQHSYNQYWCHLNQAPLPANEQWARHHADIAFAQLKQLWQNAGTPENLVILVPGSFTDQQLALLLGMAGALPARPLAVIDSALAACLQAGGERLFVDLQLHQCVLSLCRLQGRQVEISEQEVFPELGAIQVHNTVARHISTLLIDSARYDPLHASDSEQAIFDQAPEWLARLRWEDEVPATLHTRQGELPFILHNAEIRRLLQERMRSIHAFLARYPDSRVLLSHASGMLTGLSDDFAGAELAGKADAVGNVLAHRAAILPQVPELYRVRSLEADWSEAPPAQLNGRLATHLLLDNQALPLHKPVNIRVAGGRLERAGRMDTRAGLTLVLRNQALEMLHNATGLEASLPAHCVAGESVTVGGHQLPLIEVRDA
jgi:hypothetical protein